MPADHRHSSRPGSVGTCDIAAAPTAFPELNRVLADLVEGARAILGDNFCGAYLQGSFAVGDADEHSDVDFIIVTHEDLSEAQQSDLQTLQEHLYGLDTSWAQHLEGSYVPKELLRRVDPARTPWFYFDNGATEPQWDKHDNTAVVRWSLRECGVVLFGPDPQTLIDPVSAADLQREVVEAIDDWAEWVLTIEMSRRAQGLIVLSFCRILHTLATGGVTSKRQAGQWALDALPVEWAPLIQHALDDRPDPWRKVHEPADRDAAERTLAFIDFGRGSS